MRHERRIHRLGLGVRLRDILAVVFVFRLVLRLILRRRLVDHEYGCLAVLLDQRRARHSQRVIAMVVDDLDAPKHARFQIALAAEFAGHAERAAGSIDHGRNAQNRAGEFAFTERVGFEFDDLSLLENTELALGHVEHGLQWVHADNAKQVLVGLDQVAELHRAFGDDAAYRRDNACVRKLQFRGLISGALAQHVEICLIVIALGDQALLDRLLGVRERRVGLVHQRLSLSHAGDRRSVIEFGKQLAFVHRHAFFDQEFLQEAGGLRRHLSFVIGDQGSGTAVTGADRLARRRSNLNGHGLGRRSLRGCGCTILVATGEPGRGHRYRYENQGFMKFHEGFSSGKRSARGVIAMVLY